MHRSTAQLILSWQAGLEAQMDRLRNAYKGETAFVVSCGPSTTKVLSEGRQDMLDNQLVLAIKHAYDLLPHAVDYHLLTQSNLKHYEYTQQTLVLKTAFNGKPQFCEWGLSLPVSRLGRPVNVVQDFEDWEFTKTLRRPKGPGVMTELGLYLPVHFGCARVVVIGWDYNLADLRHYYDKSVADVKLYSKEARWLYKAVPAIRGWLESHGIELLLCSPGSALDIPQIPPSKLREYL